MNMMIAINTEWKGPRCSTSGISKSMSGITERVKTMGTLTLVLVMCPINFADRYPKAKWPTAYDFIPPLYFLQYIA